MLANENRGLSSNKRPTMTQPHESVTEWVLHLKRTGDDDTTQRIWQRYMAQLVDLARRKLGASSKKVADKEDVAIIAFEQFCDGAKKGRFPKLNDRDDLWQILVMLVGRRAIDHKRKRNYASGEASGWEIGQIASHEPTPELATELSENLTNLIGSLEDSKLERVVMLKMAAHTNEEIAAAMDCSVRSVERRLKMIRKRWNHVFENQVRDG